MFERREEGTDRCLDGGDQGSAARLIEKWGHTVRVVICGQEARAALERSFGVALMDKQTPEMAGIEATAEIRKREAATGKHTPIIPVTVHAIRRAREHYLAAGMDSYVSKPIRPKELLRESCTHAQPSGSVQPPSTPPRESRLRPAAESTIAGQREGRKSSLAARTVLTGHGNLLRAAAANRMDASRAEGLRRAQRWAQPAAKSPGNLFG